MAAQPVSVEALEAFLVAHKRWHVQEDTALVATITFKSFPEAIEFVAELAEAAEDLEHHPRITIDYTRVMLELTTHDADNTITTLDTALAKRVERILDGE